MSRAFLDASIPELVEKLKANEKFSLLGAPNWWNTNAVPRLNIPSVRMSDGPNCETSMASTFDTDLVHGVGVFLAEETKIKSSVILLTPTCNIQRNPLGGRAFESFSEDPHLSGIMAAAYVGGLQSRGVAATMKHFVANDQESERTVANSVMSDRALREIYLYPFMLAQRDAKPWAYMTSYGRLWATHCSENPRLLEGILRGEWGHEGVIMSDWHGVYGTDQSINAGLDLEMPGPPHWRTEFLIQHCLTSQKLSVSAIDKRVANMLTFVQKMAALQLDIVFGDGEERSRDKIEMRTFCRKVAAEGMVLLKNTGNVLPITPAKVKIVAVIAFKPTYVVKPFDGNVQNASSGLEITYEVGCYSHKFLPTLEAYLKTPDGLPGWWCTFYTQDALGNPDKMVAQYVVNTTAIRLNDFLPPGLTPHWTIKLEGKLTMDETAVYELGRARLWVNGKLTIDNWAYQTPGDYFYGQGTIKEKADVRMEGGQAVDILVEYTNTLPPNASSRNSSQPALMRGVRFGGIEKIDVDEAIRNAVALATNSDVVIYIGGLTPEWESEGFDRSTLHIPGRRDELISKLGEANPNTVVCIQAGSAVAMPWEGNVNAIVQAWYSGNEARNALADILHGIVNPSGRLSLTLPVRIQDIPPYPFLRPESGEINYHEDLLVGYKYYQAKIIKPLFSFGYGLSYRKFAISNLVLGEVSSHEENFSLKVAVKIANSGDVHGSCVVQLYISLPDIDVTTPQLQLKGFAKAKDLAPRAGQNVVMSLDKYAISFWDAPQNRWCAKAGLYRVFVGFSSEELPLQGVFKLEKTFVWSGL